MVALPLQTLTQFRPRAASMSPTPSCMEKHAMPQNLHGKFPSLKVRRLSRRLLLQFLGFNPVLLCVYPIVAAPVPEMKDPEVISIQDLQASQWRENSSIIHSSRIWLDLFRGDICLNCHQSSDIDLGDVVEGEGSEAHEGDLVEVNYVCRRSNGYFVHSTVDQFSGESKPITLPLDDNQIIKGLKEVLIGMRVGGKRRALIPPSLGYINENLKPIPEEFGPRRSLFSHTNEPLLFEVQLLKVI